MFNATISSTAPLPLIQLEYPVGTAQSCGFQLDFGPVTNNSSQTLLLRVNNAGGAVLNITGVAGIAAPFAVLESFPVSVPIGAFAELHIVFSPTALGNFQQDISLTSNASATCNILLSAFVFDFTGGGATLRPGDLMIVGYDTITNDSGDDIVSITNLVALPPNTAIQLINASYELDAAPNVRNRRWFSATDAGGKGVAAQLLVYNGASALPAGTLICFRVPGSGAITNIEVNGVPSSDFVVVTNLNCSNSSFVLPIGINISSSQPDTFFIGQGRWIDPGAGNEYLFFDGRILAGLQEGGLWHQVSDNTNFPVSTARRRSRIPPDIECFALQGAATPDRRYAYYNGSKTGSQAVLISAIINYSGNWIAVSTPLPNGNELPASTCGTDFSVSGTAVAGVWTGAEDSNWFNCRNWETFAVPDRNIDVLIGTAALQGANIVYNAPFANRFAGIAEARNLIIAQQSVALVGTPLNRLDIYENLLLGGTGLLRMDDGNPATLDGTVNLFGNWNNTMSQTAFAEGNGTIHFVGTSAQSITTVGGTETFANITFDNITSIILNNTNALVAGTATFTNGILTADNAATARIEFLNNATATNANANSYVNGWVRKVGNQAFTFPLGDEGFYAPAGISAPILATDHFTATYRRVSPNPFDIGQKSITLDRVGNCEYWIIDRTNGISNVNVTLSYDNVRSCGITAGQEGDLRVARWDGSLWQNEGNINTTASTITSNIINNFSPFTLASTTAFNPLPVELLGFEARLLPNGQAELRWQTSQEVNNAGFEVERSANTRNFERIGFVGARGGNGLQSYAFTDPLFAQEAYYRLRQIDLDGTATYSKIVYLKAASSWAQWRIFPNPTRSGLYIEYGGEVPADVQMRLSDARGTVRYRYQGTWQGLPEALYREVEKLPVGLYILQIGTAKERFQQKIVKE